jgi:hypothetical protein
LLQTAAKIPNRVDGCYGLISKSGTGLIWY